MRRKIFQFISILINNNEDDSFKIEKTAAGYQKNQCMQFINVQTISIEIYVCLSIPKLALCPIKTTEYLKKNFYRILMR